MAVDPKVVGGGVAVVAIGGGSGYAISQATSSSEIKQTPQPSPEEIKTQNKTNNKKALEALGFTIETNDETAAECKTKLEKKSLSSEEDFKEAVKACVKGKKFSDKASKLGLDVLTSSNENNWDSDDSWWNANKNEISKIITSATSTSNGSTVKTHVTSFCTETGTETTKGNKEINEGSTDDNGKNFLKACTKDKANTAIKNDLLNKNFGTGAASTTTPAAA